MTQVQKLKSFGVRELWIAKLNEQTNQYEPIKRAEGIQKIDVNGISSSYQLEGDDAIIETQTVLEGYNWSFDVGVLDFDTLSIMEGGTVSADGQEYVNNTEDEAPYFGLIGRVVGSHNLKVILPKCKAESVNQSYSTKNYAVVSASGTAIKDSAGDMRIMKTDEEPITNADLPGNKE